MIWKETFLVVWACVLLLSACSSPRDIIFDADIGSSTDDLMALQLLLRRHDAGECRLSGVVVDRMGDSCVMVADVMDTYYGHPCVPLGTERDGVRLSKVFTPYTFILNDTTDEGKPLFARTIKDCSELPFSLLHFGGVIKHLKNYFYNLSNFGGSPHTLRLA